MLERVYAYAELMMDYRLLENGSGNAEVLDVE